jgi:hypothetical protein
MTLPLESLLSISIKSDTQIIRGSGTLLSIGSYVITAAHLFDQYDSSKIIEIQSATGVAYTASEIIIHHNWDSLSLDINYDIALIKLQENTSNQGVSLRQGDSITGFEFTLTGFGNSNELHTGTNVFDGDASEAFNLRNHRSIIENSQVIYDFDNGQIQQNTVQELLGIESSELPTLYETLAKSGDSGGALLIDNEIAAISSYVFRNADFDINTEVDSSPGEVGVATFIYPYLPWIESIINGNVQYTEPSKAENVLTSVSEPFKDGVINHFLLEMHLVSSETVRLHYETRDGTAIAGSDYRYDEGWIELLPGEQSVAIGVFVYGDTDYELDETFSLVISDPTGTWLPIGIELIASHTIVNNDIY